MKNQRQDMGHLMMGEWELFLKSNVILENLLNAGFKNF